MAEEINTLDPLGPQYGGNASIPTVQNFLPFEGQGLKDPEIQTPPVRPVLPGPEPFSNPTYPIKKNNTGSPYYVKPDGKNPNTSPKDAFGAWVRKSVAEAEGLESKHRYGKTYAYNAGPTGIATGGTGNTPPVSPPQGNPGGNINIPSIRSRKI